MHIYTVILILIVYAMIMWALMFLLYWVRAESISNLVNVNWMLSFRCHSVFPLPTVFSYFYICYTEQQFNCSSPIHSYISFDFPLSVLSKWHCLLFLHISQASYEHTWQSIGIHCPFTFCLAKAVICIVTIHSCIT